MRDKPKRKIEWYSDKVDLNQKDAVLEFLGSNIWKEKDGAGMYNKKYLANPAGKAHIWVARAKPGDKIVSSYVAMPWDVQFNGSKRKAMQAVDVFTNFRYRMCRIYESHDREAPHYFRDKDVAFFFAFPNTNAVKGHINAGWKKIGEIDRWVKVFKFNHIFKKVLKNNVLANILGSLADILLFAFRRDAWTSTRHYQIGEVNSFDSRFDQLWARVSTQYNAVVVKNAKYLQWKFDSVSGVQRTILTIQKDVVLQAYAILEMKDGYAAIADIFTDKEPRTINVLIAAICRYLRAQEIDAVNIMILENGFLAEYFQKFGFHARPSESVLMGTPVAEDIKEDQFFDPVNWHITFGDCDVDSMV